MFLRRAGIAEKPIMDNLLILSRGSFVFFFLSFNLGEGMGFKLLGPITRLYNCKCLHSSTLVQSRASFTNLFDLEIQYRLQNIDLSIVSKKEKRDACLLYRVSLRLRFSMHGFFVL